MGSKFRCYVVGDDSLTIKCSELLLEQGHRLRGVISSSPEVTEWAAAHDVPLLDPASDLLTTLKAEPFDFLFSIANLRILPQDIVALPERGTINFHDGPLPRYAGLHATSWALINREPTHGVTWHYISDTVDGGDILQQSTFDIEEGESAYELNFRCFEAGFRTFADLVPALSARTAEPRSQDLSERTYCGKFQRPDAACVVSWRQPAVELDALVRALEFGPVPNPLGSPKILIDGDLYRCSDTTVTDAPADSAPGTVLEAGPDRLVVATGDGALGIRRLQTLAGNDIRLADLTERLGTAPGSVLDEPPDAALDRLTALNADLCRHETYWVRRLHSLLPAAVPHKDGPRDGPTGRATTAVAVPGGLHAFLKDRHPLWSPGELLMSAFCLYLARVGGESEFDVRVRATDGGTRDADGVFSDEIPLRVWIDPDADFERLHTDFLAALEDIRGHGTFARDVVARYPELDPLLGAELSELLPVRIELATAVDAGDDTDADVELAVHPDAQHCYLRFDTRVLSADDAGLIARQFAALLSGIVSGADVPVADLPLVSEAESIEILDTWNATGVQLPADLTVAGAFEARAHANPDAVAIVCGPDELTYRQLNVRANQLARRLRRLGVATDTIVGISTERSLDMVVAMLAVLKSGGAYLPLDPTYPEERLAFMLADSRAEVLVTQENLRPTFSGHASRIVTVDGDLAEIGRESDDDLAGDISPNDLAYVTYTSGSTGRPKGVMVEHRNVVNFFAGMDQRVDHDADSVLLAVTSPSFDISVLELLWTLTRGIKVVIDAREEEPAATARGQQPATPDAHSDRPIDFSLFYFSADQGDDSSNRYRVLTEGAKFADERGFTAVWTPERHFHDFGGLYPNPAVISAALAVLTQNVGIRAGSCVAPLHSPIRIAEEWSVADNLSGGRVGIAFAAGWMPDDFAIRPESYDDRKGVMFEHIDTVQRLWRGDSVAFPNPVAGRDDVMVRTLPRPVQERLPVWVTTAGNPETYEMAAQAGAYVLTHLLGQSIEEVAEKIRLYRRAWKEAGHPGRGQVTLMLHTFVSDDSARVRETVVGPLKQYLRTAGDLIKEYSWAFPTFERTGKSVEEVNLADLDEEDLEALLDHAFDRYYETSGLFGTPEECVETINRLKAHDVDEVACLIDFGVSTDAVLENLQHLDTLRAATSRPSAAEEVSIPALIEQHGVTHFQCTPSMANMLLMDNATRRALGRLETWMIGGEGLPRSLASQATSAVSGNVINMYGPTETTVWSTTGEVGGDEETVTVGRPIANTRVYIVDENTRPVPVGVPGELLIGGEGVARGYLDRPELTAERFVRDPFGEEPGARLYRTGDLARYLSDGRIEILGRFDHQVKIRGHRVELGEIENLLCEHPDVREAVVIAREDRPGDRRLVGYVVPGNGHVQPAELKDELRRRLPAFMVPAHIVSIDALPQTPNRKVDRDALPAPEVRPAAAAAVADSGPLTTAVEARMAELWEQVLGVQEPGPDADFFDLGGHSLSALEMAVAIERAFDIKFPLRILVAEPVLATLARRVEELVGADWHPDREQQEPVAESAEPLAAEPGEPGEPEARAAGDSVVLPIDRHASFSRTEDAAPESTQVPTSSGHGPIKRLFHRALQVLALYAPGIATTRVWLHRMRGVEIGDHVNIGLGVLIETAHPELVSIGNKIEIGIRTVIIGHFRETADEAKAQGRPTVRIEDEAFVGPNVTILPNVTIGRGSVVTAGSVVNESVPPKTVVHGNPAAPVARCEVPLTGNENAEFMKNLVPIAGGRK